MRAIFIAGPLVGAHRSTRSEMLPDLAPLVDPADEGGFFFAPDATTSLQRASVSAMMYLTLRGHPKREIA